MSGSSHLNSDGIYQLHFSWAKRGPGLRGASEFDDRAPGPHPHLAGGTSPVGTGFSAGMAMPRFTLDAALGRTALLDFESFGARVWLVSSRAKAFLENQDSSAFVFEPALIAQNATANRVENYWLMDVIRQLDALDEFASNEPVRTLGDGTKFIRMPIGCAAIYRRRVVEPHKVFRLTYNAGFVACTAAFIASVQATNLTGIGWTLRGRLDES